MINHQPSINQPSTNHQPTKHNHRPTIHRLAIGSPATTIRSSIDSNSTRTGYGWNSEGESGSAFVFRLLQNTRSTQRVPEAHDAWSSASHEGFGLHLFGSYFQSILTTVSSEILSSWTLRQRLGNYAGAAFFRADFFFAAFLRAAGLRAAAFFRPAPFTLAALRFLGFGAGISSTHLPSW